MPDIVTLSRFQFALTIMFHYLFPPLTIGMGVVLVYLRGRSIWSKEAAERSLYESATKFWTQLYAATFVVGVATGIVMEFQFGTNWAVYSRFVGDVFGSALAAEGIFAFFLESGFLAVLIFGWDKVSARFHFFATVMVALGSIFSSVWIVVANSWQQTPKGHHIVPMIRDGNPWIIDGLPIMRAEIVDFWAMVFNPSSMDRLSHTLIGAFILGAFFIMSISAWYILKNRHVEFAKRSFSGALIFATLFSLAQLVSGHSNAKMVAKYQPAKLAAFEGVYQSGPAGLSLFGIPDDRTQKLRYSIEVPGMLSWLVHEDTNEPVTGLNQIRPEDRPNVPVPFFSYHLMIALGMLFIALTVYGSFELYRGKLWSNRPLLWVFVSAVLLAMAANQLGWVAAETGRQPWTVHPNVILDSTSGKPLVDGEGFIQYQREEGLRTNKAISESVGQGEVAFSIILFGLIYSLLLFVWLFVLNHKIQKGPDYADSHLAVNPKGLIATAAEVQAEKSLMTPEKG